MCLKCPFNSNNWEQPNACIQDYSLRFSAVVKSSRQETSGQDLCRFLRLPVWPTHHTIHRASHLELLKCARFSTQNNWKSRVFRNTRRKEMNNFSFLRYASDTINCRAFKIIGKNCFGSKPITARVIYILYNSNRNQFKRFSFFCFTINRHLVLIRTYDVKCLVFFQKVFFYIF